MKNIAALEKNVPTPMSIVRVVISYGLAPTRSATRRRPSAFSSSTSCDACQKKRYGEMVVPRIATSVAHAPPSFGMCGTKVSCATTVQFGPT